MKIIGIDPGLKGGIAIIGNGHITLHAMPLIGDKDYDIQAIANIFRRHTESDLVCIEKQGAMPGQGLSSTFKTGMGFGILLGVLQSMGLRYDIVPPQRWQRQLFVGLPSKQDTKVSSEIVAKRLFPHAVFKRTERSKTDSDGLTDAACIAEFARRTMGGGRELLTGSRSHIPNPDNESICLSCGAFIPIADDNCVPRDI